MAFTVEDLNDLLALLEKHPEWKERLRQVLLTEDLLRLPSVVNRLVASVDRLAEAVERLNQWQQQTNEQLRQLLEWQQEMIQWQRETTQWQRETTQWQKQVNEQLNQLIEWQRETIQWQQQVNEQLRQINEQLRELIEWQQEMKQWRLEVTEWQRRADERFDRIERDLARLKGAEREWYYILRAPAVFGILVTKGRDPRNEVMLRLHDAVKKGLITRKELKTLRDADHLWLGEYDGKEILLVVEVSYTISHEDLVRALQRAEVARQIGYNAVPVAAGAEVPDEIWEHARNLNVIVMSDGETDFDFAEQVIKQAVGLESQQEN
ncbi:MAG: hypothetical protein RMK89_10475 [Armatimonadota bacterium]|nr:hypothetical protein [Armatimonadota bacterium]MDW8143874.1 hypothetical protein [Armatimonadota bacterium]